MRYAVFATILLLRTLECFPQNQVRVDSLAELLAKAQDPMAVASLNLELAKEYKRADTASTARYCDAAIQIAQANAWYAKWAEALYIKGWPYMVLGDYAKAEVLFRKSVALSEEHQLPKQKANGLNGLGVLSTYQSNYYPALDYYFKSVELSKSCAHAAGLANGFNNIAIIYYYLGDYKNALDYSYQALEVKQELKDEREIALSHNNIGYFYGELGDHVNAAIHHQQAVEIRKRIGDRAGLAESYSNIGESLNGRHRFSEATGFFHTSLAIYDSLGFQADKTYALIGLGKAYVELDSLPKADHYLSEGLRIAQATGFTSNVNVAALALSRIAKEKGDYKEALELYELFHQTSDSLRNEEQTKKITRLADEFRFEEAQEAERATYQATINEGKQRQQITYYVLFASLSIMGLVIFFNSKLRRLNRETSAQKDDLELLNATKNRFFSIISHDLRGPLTNMLGFNDLINNHIKENYRSEGDDKLNQITDYLKNASTQVLGLLDSLLSWAMKEEGAIPYHPAILSINECVSETCKLLGQQARNKKITLECSVDGSVHGFLDKNTFMTILRNLVSNALKFTPEGGHVTLFATNGDGVHLKVQDDGVGMSPEKLTRLYDIDEQKVSKGTGGEQGTGLGLNLVFDFVKMNKGTIEVDSEQDEGTTFHLYFPAGDIAQAAEL